MKRCSLRCLVPAIPVAIVLMAAGCGKKAEYTTSPPTDTAGTPPAAAPAEPVVAQPDAQAVPQTVAPPVAAPESPDAAYANAQVAFKDKDYEKAVDIMTAQPATAVPLTPAQSRAALNQQRQFQRDLAAAAAAGDPRAIAAIKKLQAASAPH